MFNKIFRSHYLNPLLPVGCFLPMLRVDPDPDCWCMYGRKGIGTGQVLDSPCHLSSSTCNHLVLRFLTWFSQESQEVIDQGEIM